MNLETNLQQAQTVKKFRKILKGFVVSSKNLKTIVIKVENKFKHPLYHKLVISHKKYHAHDETEQAKDGDFVSIIETRPISAKKNWKLHKILIKAK